MNKVLLEVIIDIVVYLLLFAGFFFSNWKMTQKKKQGVNETPWPFITAVFFFAAILIPLFFFVRFLKLFFLVSVVIFVIYYRDVSIKQNKDDNWLFPKGYGPD